MITATPITASPISAQAVAARGVMAGRSITDQMPWLFDFNAPLTARPEALQRMDATYTRNSVKNVVQDGVLVQLAANQFGTSQDPVTGLYGYVPEPAATNLLYNSGLSGPSGAPTDWAVATSGTYTLASAQSTRNPYCNSLSASATSGYSIILRTASVSANTTYTGSIYVTSVTGGLTARKVINTNTSLIPAGATISWPACEANPSGGGDSVITTGTLAIQYTIAATAGSVQLRAGAGTDLVATTGSVTFDSPQVESGLRVTSWILSPTGSTATRAADVLSVPLWVNNCKDSQDCSTNNWTKSNCTASTSGTAPDGTATAQLITVGATGSAVLNNSSCKAPSGVVTASVWVKKGSRNTCDLLLRNNTTSTNFSTGILSFTTGIVSGTGWTATDVGAGWFKCTYTRSTDISVGDALWLYAHFTGGPATAGSTAYVWGAQIEAGATATAYRPTTSTLESVANQNIPGFNSAGYTLYVDCRRELAFTGGVESQRGICVSDGTANNRSNITPGMGNIAFATISGGVAQDSTSGSNYGITRQKAAYSCAVNSFLHAVNSSTVTSDASGTMPSGLSVLEIGHLNGSQQFNGYIYRVGIVPQALTQAQINGLTTL